MAPQKRKHPHDSDLEPPPVRQPHIPTRQSIRRRPDTGAGTTQSADHELRSGRVRASIAEDVPEPKLTRPASRGKESDASRAAVPDPVPPTATRQTKNTRQRIAVEPPKDDGAAKAEEEEAEIPKTARPSFPMNTVKRATRSKPPQNRLLRSPLSPSPIQPKPPSFSPVQKREPTKKPSQRTARSLPAVTTSGPTPPVATTSTSKRTLSKKPKTPKPSGNHPGNHPGSLRADRNVDKVVFGNMCFKAWYPSYYGKEVLGNISTNVRATNARIGAGKRGLPILDRLYICPCCFKYSKEMAPWRQHVQLCERKRFVPGTKVYTHPRHSKTVSVPQPNPLSSAALVASTQRLEITRGVSSGRRADKSPLRSGEWSVWEVDGDNESLFCQNLSLFAKLFLDNKSVFFDVTGFNYFLLVYTPAPCKPHPHAQASRSAEPLRNKSAPNPQARHPSTPALLLPHNRPQIVGFFSKEKMSWDNNNLACILVFPPWQRKGLGALLMGVSYEISRREGILGGPEKPISELGRKGYKRFWAGEVARWLLELNLPVSLRESAHSPKIVKKGTDKEKEVVKDKFREQENLIVDVEQCSHDTWIAPEDCLAVLREMGVVEEAGLGPPRRIEVEGAMEWNNRPGKEGRVPPVRRVRIDKAAVRAWARENKIGLTKACDPGGFVEGYALRQVEGEDREETEL
ncbi:acyl-CoA N-acyltransferase [Xylaria sp. CBS 124048]|nr:acyl-CoA N-acyltransferase [Xylaria sp. CBS 124048]